MPLTMIYEQDLYVPLVYCDHCQCQIVKADDGIYQCLWTDRPTRIYFTHNACCAAFRRAHGGHWLTMPLELLPAYLVHNLAIDWKEAQRRADFWSRL